MTFESLVLGAAMAAGTAACVAVRLWASHKSAVVELAGFRWTRRDFCRGWLITGDTGSGKTRSGITPLLFQVFKNEPRWGGLCIDDKGLYWETLQEMARHFGRENDLILLGIRPDGAPSVWQPQQTYNLTSDRSIPYNTFAKAVIDTASSLGQAAIKASSRTRQIPERSFTSASHSNESVALMSILLPRSYGCLHRRGYSGFFCGGLLAPGRRARQ